MRFKGIRRKVLREQQLDIFNNKTPKEFTAGIIEANDESTSEYMPLFPELYEDL